MYVKGHVCGCTLRLFVRASTWLGMPCSSCILGSFQAELQLAQSTQWRTALSNEFDGSPNRKNEASSCCVTYTMAPSGGGTVLLAHDGVWVAAGRFPSRTRPAPSIGSISA